MRKEKAQFKFLVHCNIRQIQEGFDANIKSLPCSVDVHYANLMLDGIQNELKRNPHLIVILLHESDSDFLLLLKIKLFAQGIPILIILPSIPETYNRFLRKIGATSVIQLPADDNQICRAILDIIEINTHGKP